MILFHHVYVLLTCKLAEESSLAYITSAYKGKLLQRAWITKSVAEKFRIALWFVRGSTRQHPCLQDILFYNIKLAAAGWYFLKCTSGNMREFVICVLAWYLIQQINSKLYLKYCLSLPFICFLFFYSLFEVPAVDHLFLIHVSEADLAQFTHRMPLRTHNPSHLS